MSADSSFESMAAGTKRKYIMISGKGGVGKTSLAASLAVKFAAAGHTTLVVSTDPAHSLSDSLDQVLVCSLCTVKSDPCGSSVLYVEIGSKGRLRNQMHRQSACILMVPQRVSLSYRCSRCDI